jgi:hypothetical protein
MNNEIPANGTRQTVAPHLTAFVVTLGHALLEQKQRDWLDMDAVADFCQGHGVELNGTCAASGELESALREVFQDRDECYAPGLNVDGYERKVGWDWKFMIRAYTHGLARPSTSAAIDERGEALAPSLRQETAPESPGKWAMEKSL